MTWLLAITIMLAAWGALPTMGDDPADDGRPLSQQTAGCCLAVWLALFIGAQVLS